LRRRSSSTCNGKIKKEQEQSEQEVEEEMPLV
jgi:hypothetical protein